MDKALAFEGATTQVSWDNVTGKPDSYPPETHTHGMAQVTGLEDELSSIQDEQGTLSTSIGTLNVRADSLQQQIEIVKSDVNDKANIEHTHEIADVTNLQAQLNGKAASSHNHSASNITSGTLGTARGGTGITANPSMLVDLDRTTAASVFQTSPRPGVIGTLPVARGGTGVTSLSALKTALGLPSTISNSQVLYVRSRVGSNTYTFDPPITAAALVYARYHYSGQYDEVFFGIGWGYTNSGIENACAVCERGSTLNLHRLQVNIPSNNSVTYVSLSGTPILRKALQLSSNGKTLTVYASEGERDDNYIEGLVITF